MTSRSEFVRIRGLRYHVRRWGDPGAPMIFAAHGWLDVSATFDALARQLLPQFQLLMPDWRGFGHSEWPQDGYWFPDYVADLDALVAHYAPSDAPILLAGHSMGAQVVSLYAGLRPERVAKLAILVEVERRELDRGELLDPERVLALALLVVLEAHVDLRPDPPVNSRSKSRT